jgi:hypothetical protein
VVIAGMNEKAARKLAAFSILPWTVHPSLVNRNNCAFARQHP